MKKYYQISGLKDQKINDKATFHDVISYFNEMMGDIFNLLASLFMLNPQEKNNMIYQIIIGVFIVMSQIYCIVIASMNFHLYHDIGKAGIVIGIIIRIYFTPKMIDLNIIDTLLHPKRTWRLFQDKITLCIIIILYFASIIVLIVTSIISR